MSHSRPSPDYLATLRRRYAQAGRGERSAMLDEFCKTTGYHRKHAIALLRGQRRHRSGPIRRPRARTYLPEDQRAVLQLAEWFDRISSRRLRAAMDATLTDLQRQGHLQVSPECFARLQVVSSATLDRLRAAARSRVPPRRGHTRPGTWLKRQIPIRTFADWDDARPGLVEVDLVDHSGGQASGEFAQTLTATDVSTGWTEMRAVRTKAQKYVFDALQAVRHRLPMPLLGIDSDNGAEFINDQLVRYCTREEITFTRGRVGRKNDNAYVEQKNGSVVRRLIGYDRYDTLLQVYLLNRLYDRYRLYVNFFLPVTKLQAKVRVGSRVKKVYDAPQTPSARLRASPQVSHADQARLQAQYASLDVVALKGEIDRLLEALQPSPIRETSPQRAAPLVPAERSGYTGGPPQKAGEAIETVSAPSLVFIDPLPQTEGRAG